MSIIIKRIGNGEINLSPEFIARCNEVNVGLSWQAVSITYHINEAKERLIKDLGEVPGLYKIQRDYYEDTGVTKTEISVSNGGWAKLYVVVHNENVQCRNVEAFGDFVEPPQDDEFLEWINNQ